MSGDVPALQVFSKWREDPALLDQVRGLFVYGLGEDRATGYLYAQGETPWPDAFAETGDALLADLNALLGVRFEVCAFQGYRDGAGCGWHTDTPFDAQAVLSLGVTRTFGVRQPDSDPQWTAVGDGDLVVMPSGFQQAWEHCVPVEDVPGERISLVFRTVVRS